MALASKLVPMKGSSAHLQRLLATLESIQKPIQVDVLTDLLRQTPLTVSDVAAFCRFRDDCYCRNTIYRTVDFEVLCLCWRSGQASPFHDHNRSVCAVRVLHGVMTNIDAEKTGAETVRAIRTTYQLPGAVDGRVDRDIHQLLNQQPMGNDLVTLHVYSPPLQHMNHFRLESSETK